MHKAKRKESNRTDWPKTGSHCNMKHMSPRAVKEKLQIIKFKNRGLQIKLNLIKTKEKKHQLKSSNLVEGDIIQLLRKLGKASGTEHVEEYKKDLCRAIFEEEIGGLVEKAFCRTK